MNKKIFILFMILALILPVMPTHAQQEQIIHREIELGYYDIWRHSDGVTWQYTGQPGDYKEFTFNIAPPPGAENYTNVYFTADINITEDLYEAAGRRHGLAWDDFDSNFNRVTPQNYELLDNTPRVGFNLLGRYDDIKKTEQAQLVLGRRYYLPIYIEWYGTPIDPPPEVTPEDPTPPPPAQEPIQPGGT